MAAKNQLRQWLSAGVKIGAVAVCGVALMAPPVLAQFGGRQGNSGMFDSFFGPFSGQRGAPVERQQDYSRAPSPRKLDGQPAGGSILVLGDSMADWLAYGLEDALGDPPDFAVVRRNRAVSGLLRYDSRNEAQDWASVTREAIAAVKPKFIVMMLGLNDRLPIRERIQVPAPSGAAANRAPPANAGTPPASAAKPENSPSEPADAERTPDQPAITVAEPPAKGGATGPSLTYEFRTDEWAVAYTKKIDATIAAMKSAGVPVFWVGLPAIRGAKSTADMQFLDDLFRARAEKAGVGYIDVWDGFVDETGRFTVSGPDFEGQIRRLRVSDGVHFTKAGARKLAHYLEREIRRVMTPGSEPIALPQSEQVPAPTAAKPSGPAARPIAGPVVPLTTTVATGGNLIGAGDIPAPSEPKIVTRVLVNGEALAPPAGRSDDFKWPRRDIAPFGADPVVATTTEPIPVMKPAPETTVAAPDSETRPVASGAAGTRKTAVRTSPPPQQFRSPFSFFSFGR